MNFRGGLVHRRRRTGVEPLNLAIFHLMQRHFADIVRCVALCNIQRVRKKEATSFLCITLTNVECSFVILNLFLILLHRDDVIVTSLDVIRRYRAPSPKRKQQYSL